MNANASSVLGSTGPPRGRHEASGDLHSCSTVRGKEGEDRNIGFERNGLIFFCVYGNTASGDCTRNACGGGSPSVAPPRAPSALPYWAQLDNGSFTMPPALPCVHGVVQLQSANCEQCTMKMCYVLFFRQARSVPSSSLLEVCDQHAVGPAIKLPIPLLVYVSLVRIFGRSGASGAVYQQCNFLLTQRVGRRKFEFYRRGVVGTSQASLALVFCLLRFGPAFPLCKLQKRFLSCGRYVFRHICTSPMSTFGMFFSSFSIIYMLGDSFAASRMYTCNTQETCRATCCGSARCGPKSYHLPNP